MRVKENFFDIAKYPRLTWNNVFANSLVENGFLRCLHLLKCFYICKWSKAQKEVYSAYGGGLGYIITYSYVVFVLLSTVAIDFNTLI